MKYKKGDPIRVRLMDWALHEFENKPFDGIVDGIFCFYSDHNNFAFTVDKEIYGQHPFNQIYHCTDRIINDDYRVDLL